MINKIFKRLIILAAFIAPQRKNINIYDKQNI